MKSFLAFFFGLIAVFSFVNVCEGSTSSDDAQEQNGEISAYTTDVENAEIESITKEIEDELEEALADMIAENEDNTAELGSSQSTLPLMFPSLKQAGKSNRKLNKDMAVKVASIVEQAALLVANDILQTAVILQIDPAEFMQTNTTSTSE